MTYIIDIETTGLNRKTDKINVVGILEYETGTIYQTTKWSDFIELANKLDLKASLCIMHNAKFDAGFIDEDYGYRLGNTLDTIMLAYLYNPYRKYYALKGLVADLFGFEYDVDLETKTGVSQEMLEYNKTDLQVTALLYKYFSERLSEKEIQLAKYLTSIDAIYNSITEKGVLVDTKLCKAELKKAAAEIDRLAHKIKSKTGEINLNSSQQLADVLFNKLGYTPTKKTGKGAWSVGTDVLKGFATELTDDLVEYKRLEKLRSSFLQPYSLVDRIFPYFKLTSTTSGRTSSSKPNLQQLPRGSTVRNLLKVPNQHYYFVEIDYSQMELRCAGQIAKVREIIKAYNEDQDIHTLTAKAVTGKDEITEQDRFQAKAVNFGRPK